MRVPKTSPGVTLLEVTIVLGISLLLLAIIPLTDSQAYRRYLLTSEKDSLVYTLQRARNQAINNVNQAPHGVYIEQNAYILFQGASYASRNSAYDNIIPSSSQISKNGMQEIIFEQLNGNGNTNGLITLSNNSHSLTISINTAGQIDS